MDKVINKKQHSLKFTLTLIYLVSMISQVIAETKPISFTHDIEPLLQKYCINCHGPDKQKADLRIDELNPDMINGEDAYMWQEALDLINISDMPPLKNKVHPTGPERKLIVEWLTTELNAAMIAKRSTGGKVVTRRLTSYEYQNTLRDLLQVDLPYAENLPPEGSAEHGYKNNYSTLITSGLHLEYYERIARQALEKIILTPEVQPKPYLVHFEPELAFTTPPEVSKKKKKSKKKPSPHIKKLKISSNVSSMVYYTDHVKDRGVLLAGNRVNDSIESPFEADKKMGGLLGLGRDGFQPSLNLNMKLLPHKAPIRIRIKAGGIKGKNNQLPNLSLELGCFRGNNISEQKEVTSFNVTASVDQPEIYEFIIQGENFPLLPNADSKDSYLRIFNESRRGTTKLSYEDLPKLFIDWVEVTAHHYETWPPKEKQAILFAKSKGEDELNYVSKVLTNFMTKAYRRPVTEEEVHHKVKLYQKLKLKQKSFEASILPTLVTILCSPNFLFITELVDTILKDTKENKKRKINDYELASRLSYFLWSSMPDERLLSLAEKRILHQDKVLSSEVKRMIKDEKSKSFIAEFTSQWLNLDAIEQIAVNPAVFNKFKLKNKSLFKRETEEFIQYIFENNLSIVYIIDSDFAVINHELAKHYRIPNITTAGFQKVNLSPSQNRGGILTQASVLFSNSTGADTHPIKRGSWLLEKILNDPPPPPPPNAPELPEEKETNDGPRSLKDRLADHAKIESCQDCHRKIDPWGVAFENYNALGQWREGERDENVSEKYQHISVDPSTTLKNSTKIKNLSSLKSYLLKEKKDKFVQSFISNMMSYSLGRYTEFSDKIIMNEIQQSFQKNQYKMQSLIELIVFSEPFKTK